MALTVPAPDIGLRSLDATWTRARWEQLPDDGRRYEIVDGVLYVSSSPSLFHWWIQRQIVFFLAENVDRLGLGLTLWAPVGVFMPGCDPAQPDILVVLNKDLHILRDRHVNGVPSLIVEILSPSNAQQDTHIKRLAYARAEVPEYWVVRPSIRDVLVFAQPDKALGDYASSQLVPTDGELRSPTLNISTAITGFFAGAPDTTL